MKRYITIVLAILLVFTGTVVMGAESVENNDKLLNIESNVEYTFTGENGKTISSDDNCEKPLFISFVNLNADSSYFYIDDINNSEWAGTHKAKVLVVDVTNEEEDVISIIRDDFAESSIDPTYPSLEFASDPNLTDTATAFAKEAGLDYKNLSYPFTVILSPDGKLCYALEGYRKPDLLKEYANKIPSNIPNLYSYGWGGEIKLCWSSDKNAIGYEILEYSKTKNEYVEIFNTTDVNKTNFTDKDINGSCTYILKVKYKENEVESPKTNTIWVANSFNLAT